MSAASRTTAEHRSQVFDDFDDDFDDDDDDYSEVDDDEDDKETTPTATTPTGVQIIDDSKLPPELLRSSCSELFLTLFARYYARGLEKQTAFNDFLDACGFIGPGGKPHLILNQLGQRITFLSKNKLPVNDDDDDDDDETGDWDDDTTAEHSGEWDDDHTAEWDDDEEEDAKKSEPRSPVPRAKESDGWASSVSFACGALGCESVRRAFFWNYVRFAQQSHYPRSYFRFARAFRQRVLLFEALRAVSGKPKVPKVVGDWAWEFSGPRPFPVVPNVVDGDILCTIFSGMMPDHVVYFACPSTSAVRLFIAVDTSSAFPTLPRRLLRLANDPKRFMFWLSTRFSYSLPRFLPAQRVIVGYFHAVGGDVELVSSDEHTKLVVKQRGNYLGTIGFNAQGVIRRIHTLL